MWKKSTTKYQELELLGSGAFGKVYKVKRESDGDILALKKIDLRNLTAYERAAVENEVKIHSSLDHQYIVNIDSYEYDENKEFMYIFMELCSSNDLDKMITLLRNNRQLMPEQHIWRVFAQIVLAVHECHVEGVLHRDLKPHNIFITDGFQVRLGDFGLAINLRAGESTQGFAGTPRYAAPEVHNGEDYGHSADCYALGAILYQMCALRPLILENDPKLLRREVNNGPDSSIPPQYSAEMGNLIQSLLSLEKHERPDTAELLKVPGVQLGLEQIKLEEARKTIKAHQENLLEIQMQARARASELENRLRALEKQLSTTKEANEAYSAALDARERDLNSREAALNVEHARQAEIRKQLEINEEKLQQDQLKFYQMQSKRRRAHEDKKNALALREQMLTHQAAQCIRSESASSIRLHFKVTSQAGNSKSIAHLQVTTPPAVSTSFCDTGSPAVSKETIINMQPGPKKPLRRIEKQNNLRNEIVPDLQDAPSCSGEMITTPCPDTPQRKLKSDGDLRSRVLAPSGRSNIPVLIGKKTLGAAAGVDWQKTLGAAVNNNKYELPVVTRPTAAVPKQRKFAKALLSATYPSALPTPAYRTRSAVQKEKEAMDLRRA